MAKAAEDVSLTDRHQREIESQRANAGKHQWRKTTPVPLDVVESPRRRWWNALWSLYTKLRDLDLSGKRVLVVGSGFGYDAIRLTHLGAEVYGFDLSAEALDIAKTRAKLDSASAIEFRELPAERTDYEDGMFDAILAVGILHHVDIPATMQELQRVAKPGALFLGTEPYTHSATDLLRRNPVVDRFIHPLMVRFIYSKPDPYITEDERKLSQRDMRIIRSYCSSFDLDYFNVLSGRLVPQKIDLAAKMDRLLLSVAKPLGYWLAGRIVFVGTIGTPGEAGAA